MELQIGASGIEKGNAVCARPCPHSGRTISSYLASMATILSLCVVLTGCIVTRHPAGIASSSSPLGSDYIEIGLVGNDSCVFSLLGIPFGGRSESSVIIERLLKEKGADALVGLTVEDTRYLFPLLPFTGSNCTTVKGQAVRGGK